LFFGGRGGKISFGKQVKEKMVNQSNYLKDEVDACLLKKNRNVASFITLLFRYFGVFQRSLKQAFLVNPLPIFLPSYLPIFLSS
jgi:hypothetical protein